MSLAQKSAKYFPFLSACLSLGPCRAFSRDIMLSSKHGCFYSNGNQYSFMQASFSLLCVTVSPCMVQAHGAHDCPGYPDNPGQSAQSDCHVGGQHKLSENALYLFVRTTHLIRISLESSVGFWSYLFEVYIMRQR